MFDYFFLGFCGSGTTFGDPTADRGAITSKNLCSFIHNKMSRFVSLFKHVKCPVIGMIHVKALPGTPQYGNNFEEIVKEAVDELKIYKRAGVVSFVFFKQFS